MLVSLWKEIYNYCQSFKRDKMKKKFTLHTLLAVIIACTLLSLTSCEKHDGINYLKSKCTAELNGQEYIDQQPFESMFGPVMPTPFWEYSQYEATFETYLSTERGGKIAYIVRINLFVDTPEEFFHQPQTIEKIEIADTDTTMSDRDYRQYCKDNKVSYATVNGEAIDRGTFKITSYDKTEGQIYCTNCNGTFTLQFSEGTLNGTFWIK